MLWKGPLHMYFCTFTRPWAPHPRRVFPRQPIRKAQLASQKRPCEVKGQAETLPSVSQLSGVLIRELGGTFLSMSVARRPKRLSFMKTNLSIKTNTILGQPEASELSLQRHQRVRGRCGSHQNQHTSASILPSLSFSQCAIKKLTSGPVWQLGLNRNQQINRINLFFFFSFFILSDSGGSCVPRVLSVGSSTLQQW